MITTVNEVNGKYTFEKSEGTQWLIILNEDNRALALNKASSPFTTSKFKTFASDDILELIIFCINSGFIVEEPIFSDLIDAVISENQIINNGVLSGFADYLSTTGIKANEEKIKDLQDYCLTNSYQFDLRLLDLVKEA